MIFMVTPKQNIFFNKTLRYFKDILLDLKGLVSSDFVTLIMIVRTTFCPLCFILMYFYNKINKIFSYSKSLSYCLSMSLLSLARAASLLSLHTLLSPSLSRGMTEHMLSCRLFTSLLSDSESCLNTGQL